MPYYSDTPTIGTVIEALNNYTVEDLKKLIPLLQTTEKAGRKAELVQVISTYLQKNNLRQLWQRLDKTQQTAIAEVVHSSESQFNRHHFKAKYGELPNFGQINAYDSMVQPSLLKLFFYGQDIMPEELKYSLKAFVPEPPKITLKTGSNLPTFVEKERISFDWKDNKTTSSDKVSLEIRLMEKSAFNDLRTLLRLIKAGQISVSDKTKLPTSGTQTLISNMLSGGDFYIDPVEKSEEFYQQVVGSIRAFSWPLIIQAADLAELSGKKLRLTLAGEKAFSNCSEKTIKAIWKKWLKTTIFDEFRRINEIKGQTGKGEKGLTALSTRRQAIANGLADCPVNHWVQIDDFFNYLIASRKSFIVSRQPENLYICEAGYGSLHYLGEKWTILEERYTLCFLLEYAATLGVIDIAYIHPSGSRENYTDLWGTDDFDFLSRYDGLKYFRLTPLGAYCLELTNTYTAADLEIRPVFKVLPNLEIVITDHSITASDLLVLEQYAKKFSDNTWQLNQDKLLIAIAAGHVVSEIQAFLQSGCGHPLPETVIQLLKDIQQKTESLQAKGTGRLIECVDVSLAVLIANDSRTKKYCLLAGEKSLIVPLELESKFRSALQKLGYILPK